MEIKIFGPGCPNCKTLEKFVREVVLERNIKAEIIKIDDIQQIMQAGIMRSPALMIDNKMLVKGRLPSKAEISELITKTINQ
jgi:small redox-active disulfide protein 2